MSNPQPETRPENQTDAPAHEALRLWFEADKSRTYAGMARVLNMSPASISQWCRPTDPMRPGDIATMVAIAILTGIPVHAWLTLEESKWLGAMSKGEFVLLFERPKRPQTADPRQMDFDGYWRPNSPQHPAFDPDSAMANEHEMDLLAKDLRESKA